MARITVLASALVLLLAACGGAKHAHLTPADVLRHADPGDVEISFCLDSSQAGCAGEATDAQEQAVEARLKRGTCISELVFVSSAVALSYLEKHNPAIAASASSAAGPPTLPDSLTVVPAKSSCGASIAAGLKAAHLHGLAKVLVVPAAHG